MKESTEATAWQECDIETPLLRNYNFSEVYVPKSSIQYFSEVFTDKIIEETVFQTNLYATQNDVNTTFNVSMSGMKKFIGIIIYIWASSSFRQ